MIQFFMQPQIIKTQYSEKQMNLDTQKYNIDVFVELNVMHWFECKCIVIELKLN